MNTGNVTTGAVTVAPVSKITVPLTIQQVTGATGANFINIVNSSGTGIGGINANLCAYGAWAGDICSGRLTLSSTDPCPTADYSGITTLYYLPYKGRGMVTLWNPAGFWETLPLPSAGISRSIVGFGANTLCDFFVYNNNGTLALTQVAWTSMGAGTSARQSGYALSHIGDYWYPNTSPQSWEGFGSFTPQANRYVGTILTTGAGGATTDSTISRGVWNMHNQAMRPIWVEEAAYYPLSTSSTSYVFQWSNNSVSNCCAYIANGNPTGTWPIRIAWETFIEMDHPPSAGKIGRMMALNTLPSSVTFNSNTLPYLCDTLQQATLTSGYTTLQAPSGYNFISLVDVLIYYTQGTYSTQSCGVWYSTIMGGVMA